MIDSIDSDKLEKASEELHALCSEGILHDKPILILVNKLDLPQVWSTSDLVGALHLEKLVQKKWHVIGSSGRTGQGILVGLDWLLNATC